MRLYSVATNGTWLAADRANDDPTTASTIDSILIECLMATNLTVLAGLGSTLYVNTVPANLQMGRAVANGNPPRNTQPGRPDAPIAPTMATLWRTVHDTAPVDVDHVLQSVAHRPEHDGENIEVLLSRCKMALELWPSDREEHGLVTTFVAHAEAVIHGNCAFVTPQLQLPAHEMFLQRVGRRSARKTRTKIFTTNYDKCIEEAARRLRFVVLDGFSYTMPQTYDPGYFAHDIVRRERSSDAPDYVENVVQLFKLHGSVDWAREGGEIVKRANPDRPLLIYPRSSKYEQSFEPPYLDMMSAFQSTLRQHDTALIVIGFGFNDDHIAQPILAAVRSNLFLRLVVCDPGFVTFDLVTSGEASSAEAVPAQNTYHQLLKGLIDSGDPRIALIQTTFEEIAKIIPDLVAQSDRERHAERMRKLQIPNGNPE